MIIEAAAETIRSKSVIGIVSTDFSEVKHGGYRLPGELFGPGNAQDHRRCNTKHAHADSLVQQGGSQCQAKKWLQQLQLPNGGSPALGQPPVPEYKAYQHAEDRDVSQAEPGRCANAFERSGAHNHASGAINGSDSTSAHEMTCQPPSVRDNLAPSA